MSLNIKIECTKCGSYLISRSSRVEDDETIVCRCGSDIPIDEATRAELNKAIEEDITEFRKLLFSLAK